MYSSTKCINRVGELTEVRERRNELSKHIQELTFNADNVAKNTLINSPFPIVIAETNGSIIWKSNSFDKEFANIDIGNVLNNLLKQIKLEIEITKKMRKKKLIKG